MNPPKVSEYDYINFLIGTQQVYSCTEAERVQPDQENGPAHDAVTRLLHRLTTSTERLWQEAKEQVDLTKGVLIADDSTLDKWYSRQIELVTRHWSGKHKRVVSGIRYLTARIGLVTQLQHDFDGLSNTGCPDWRTSS